MITLFIFNLRLVSIRNYIALKPMQRRDMVAAEFSIHTKLHRSKTYRAQIA